jgi:hypothetical protein
MAVNQKNAPAPKETDLIGLKNSVAKDNAPSSKKVDGTPNLDGKSEFVGVREHPASSGPYSPGRPGVMAAPKDLATAKTEKAAPQPDIGRQSAGSIIPKPWSGAGLVEPRTASLQRPPAPEASKAVPSPPKVNKATPSMREPSKAIPSPGLAARTPAKDTSKTPRADSKNVGPDGIFPKPSAAVQTPEEKVAANKQPEVKPPAKPVEVAVLPPVKAPGESAPSGQESPQGADRQVMTPRLSATMPQPFIPPPMPAEGRKSSPTSSAGEKGEEAFNIKMDEYAKYYKHISQRVSSTLEILYAGDISLIKPKPAEEKIVVDFMILRTGGIADVKLVEDSGDYVLSPMILSSVRAALLDPFPRYIREGHLKIRYTFYFR